MICCLKTRRIEMWSLETGCVQCTFKGKDDGVWVVMVRTKKGQIDLCRNSSHLKSPMCIAIWSDVKEETNVWNRLEW